jgi:hypothetical protein
MTEDPEPSGQPRRRPEDGQAGAAAALPRRRSGAHPGRTAPPLPPPQHPLPASLPRPLTGPGEAPAEPAGPGPAPDCPPAVPGPLPAAEPAGAAAPPAGPPPLPARARATDRRLILSGRGPGRRSP